MKLHGLLLKGICLLFTALICLTTLLGCDESQKIASTNTSADSDAVAEIPANEDISISGYVWSIEQGAKFSDGALECIKGSRAICSDPNLPNTYILECDITATVGTDNGIAINNTDESYHYVLTINAATDKVQLNKHFENKTVTVASADFICDTETMYHVKMAVHASSVKLYLSQVGEQAPKYQILDVMIDKFRPNYLSFISTDDAS